MSFTKKELEEIKSSLIRLQTEVEKDIESTKELSKPVLLDQQSVGRVSRIDAIQQQQINLSTLSRLEHRLTQVKSAIIRIVEDEFGYCLKCEEPIEPKRLSARPESTLCLQCAGG